MIHLPVIFPPSVAVHAVRYDVGRALHDQGIVIDDRLPATIEASAPKRQLEFAAGRHCAAAALRAIGIVVAEAIPIGKLGAPVWPMSCVGSISHAAGLAAAAVVHAHEIRTLGLDLESIAQADTVESSAAIITRPSELALLAPAGDLALAFTTVFAAKEALFKCLAPIVGRYFDFLDVAVVAASPDHLRLQLRVDLHSELRATQYFDVQIAHFEAWVVAGVWLPARLLP
jgi:enterobactin synthetase component D